MRFVTITAPGRLELNYMWLPTWLGMNREMNEALDRHLRTKVIGMEITEDNLDAINELVIDGVLLKYPIEGLRDYLDGLKFVKT